MSHRFDLITHQAEPRSTSRLEYGAGDVSKDYAKKDNKFIKEGGEKLPRVLKHMVEMLIEEKPEYCNKLNITALVHSGKIKTVLNNV